MWKFITLVLMACLCVGCIESACEKKYGTCPQLLPPEQEDHWRGENLQSTLSIDPSLEAVEIEAIKAAVDAWEEATDGRIHVELVLAEEGKLPKQAVVRRAQAAELKDGELAITYTTVMKLREGLSEHRHLNEVLLHEFGHYFGLGHEPDLLEDIMYPSTHRNMARMPTPDALDDLRELYEW